MVSSLYVCEKPVCSSFILSLSGWGNTGVQETSTDNLQETQVPIVQSSICIERINLTESLDENLILCAAGAGKGPCKVNIEVLHD